MGIESGDEVQLEYVGRLSDGTVFDASVESAVDASAIPDEPSSPLSLEIGAERIVRGPGRIVEQLEDHLFGHEEGDSLTVEIPPENAYGEADEDKIVAYDRDVLGKAMGEAVSADHPEEGLTVRTPDGRIGEIVSVDDRRVTVDFNHRLAGERLEFELTVTAVK